MISMFIAFAVLVVGYFVYGKVTEKVFAPDDRQTPAVAINDGVDCVPMKTWKAFLVQLLNIAGTGPIFGALMGAVFGPVVFLWIVFGSILGGAVHDYMSGMISSRHKGASITDPAQLEQYIKMVGLVFAFNVVLLIPDFPGAAQRGPKIIENLLRPVVMPNVEALKQILSK